MAKVPRLRLSHVIDLATLAAAVSAIIVATGFVRNQRASRVAGGGGAREVAEWAAYASSGHRLGPEQASTTIIEFADYECPACRDFQPVLDELIARFPDDLAVVYRHFPLSYHRNAYEAARAAECAADQGKFAQYHELLMSEGDWLGDAFLEFASEVEVVDPVAFTACVGRRDPVDAIEADLEAAKEIGIPGTPGIIVNGTLLGTMPTVADLEKIVVANRRPKP